MCGRCVLFWCCGKKEEESFFHKTYNFNRQVELNEKCSDAGGSVFLYCTVNEWEIYSYH